MTTRPNILVFLTDDHGAWALRCQGDPVVDTPHMDALAADGVRCAEAYCCSPVCSPARASFFTGTPPSAHGIHDYLAEHLDGVRPDLAGQATLAGRLRTVGYRTGLVGKWHCGHSPTPQPGFDTWISYAHNQYPHRGPQRFSDHGRTVEWEGFQSDYFAERALEFLAQDDERPWFLFVGLVNTHSPFRDQPETLVEKYRARLADHPWPHEKPVAGPGWIRFGIPEDPADELEWLAQYYAAVETIDTVLGKIRAAAGPNTLCIYTSDHGHMNGHHGLYTKGNATVPQNFYEESIRVPLIAALSDVLPAGQVDDGFVDHTDLHATLLDAAGASQPESAHFSGISRWQAWKDRAIPHREFQCCEYGNARMIKTRRKKLILRYAPHAGIFPDEFYDLVADPRERVNRIADPSYTIRIRDLTAKLDAYYQRHEEPARSGREVLSQPECNPCEPWRLPVEQPEG